MIKMPYDNILLIQQQLVIKTSLSKMSKTDKVQESKFDKQKIDLIVIGNQNSGKTSLIKRFVEGDKVFSHFYNPTLGINLEKRQIKIGNVLVSVSIWDTAGQQKFLAITKNYFRKADGVLVIFDLTDKNSFEKVSKFWIHQVKQKASQDTSQIIIGNKVDMQKVILFQHQERVVDFQQAKKMALTLKLPYFQTSAKTGQNVEDAFEYIVKDCLKKIREQSGGGVQLNSRPAQQKNSCFSGAKQFVTSFFKNKPVQESK